MRPRLCRQVYAYEWIVRVSRRLRVLCARKWVGLGAGLNDQRVAVRVSPFVAVCEGLVGMAVLYGMRCIECMNISKIGCAEISIFHLTI